MRRPRGFCGNDPAGMEGHLINRILAAIDGSETSHRALAVAAEIASRFEAELVLIYVIRDMQLPDGVKKMAHVELAQETRLSAMQTVAQSILGDCVDMATKAGAKNIKTEIRPGDPAGSILRFASDNDMDLIVMGSRGLGEIEGMLLGSVSRKITNLSKVPCLTVK